MDSLGAKSYRQADQADPSATFTAASYLMSEWGETGYTIGFAGRWVDSTNQVRHVFQCTASDGGRFLIWSDRYGNRGTFLESLEAEVSRALNVESHADRGGELVTQ